MDPSRSSGESMSRGILARRICRTILGRGGGASRRLWWIVGGAFLASQVSITCFAANRPFVDEGLYTVAGLRVLQARVGRMGTWAGSTAVRSYGQ